MEYYISYWELSRVDLFAINLIVSKQLFLYETVRAITEKLSEIYARFIEHIFAIIVEYLYIFQEIVIYI